MNRLPFKLRKTMLLRLATAGILATAGAHAQSGSDPAAPSGSTQSSAGTTASPSAASTSAAGESSGASGATMESSGASSTGASASQSAEGKVAAQDRKLMREIAQANLAEIETGKLAQTKAENEEVKNFAQKMVDDHSKAQEELVSLAQAKGVELPQEPDAKHKAALKKMEDMAGKKFDAAYIEQVGVKDHRQTHSKLESGMKKAQDPELQAYIEKTEPVIAEHLKMAQTLTGKQSGSSTGASGATGAGETGGASSNGSGADKDAGKAGVMGPGAEKQ